MFVRPCRVAFLALSALAFRSAAAGEAIDAARATKTDGDSTLWYDVKLLGVEGQAWSETAAPFDRLPARAESLVRPEVWNLSRNSAGLCVRFVTDATLLQVRWTLTSDRLDMPHMPASGVSGLDLYVRDDEGAWRWLGNARPSAQTNTARLFDGISPGTREYRLYLPLYNGVTSVELGLAEGTTLSQPDPYAAGHETPIVFYGTSITQGGCASRPGMLHTAIIGRRLERPVINLGFSGNGRMELPVAELMAELEVGVYVIDCLPNMDAAQVTERTEPLVQLLREKRPDTPILLVEDRTYSDAFLVASKRDRNDSSRAALRAAFERLIAAGTSGLYYLEGERLLGDDNEGTVDSSHPTDLGFLRQADAFEPVLREILGEETSRMGPTSRALPHDLRPGDDSLGREEWKIFLDFADKQLTSFAGGKPVSDESSIIIDQEHPRSFRDENGKRFFPMGDTAYFLIAQPQDVIAYYIDVRREHKFNFIRMMAMADGFWPFGGTPDRPDYTTIDEGALRKLDWVFDRAAAQGMSIELILWGYGIGGGEGLWGNEANVNRWIDTLVARYRDRSNLLMYTIANEFERYPDGQYDFSEADVDWARSVAARIRERDAVHPIGCHPSVWITDQGESDPVDRPFATYGGFTQRRPQVVWPLWEDSAVTVNVTQNNEGVQPRTWGDIEGGGRGLTYYPCTWQEIEFSVAWTGSGWDFEAAGMEDCIAADWQHGRPVLNTEFGYQYEPGYESEHGYTTRQVHQPAAVRRKAWKIATAGGYFAAGFAGTAVRHFTKTDVDNFRPEQLEILYDFFTRRTEYWLMSPRLDLVASHNALLALPGVEYVAYFPSGGANAIQLDEGGYRVEWLHAETGRYIKQPNLDVPAGSRDFIPPDHPNDDWVLHLSAYGRRSSATGCPESYRANRSRI
jgi:hypothetical protein